MAWREMTTRLRFALKQLVTNSCSAALDFVFPPDCEICGIPLSTGESAFCDACIQEIKPKLADECPRCGAPVGPFANLTEGCGQCRSESFAFDRVIRLGVYDGPMRTACLRAKSDHGRTMAFGLANALYQQKQSHFAECQFDWVVPVPEHWTRRFLHSQYAAESISSELARCLRVPFCRKGLIKCRRTPKQATSPTAQRRQQQKGSFRVALKFPLKGRSILARR